MKDAVIGSPHHALWPHIARVLDQSDYNMPLSCVILKIVLICRTMYVMNFLCKSLYGIFRLNIVDKKY